MFSMIHSSSNTNLAWAHLSWLHQNAYQAFVLAASKCLPIDYLSSPEIDFLKGIKGKLPKAKLVFRFLDANVVEPTTGKSHGEILKDLKSIKTFALESIFIKYNFIVYYILKFL